MEGQVSNERAQAVAGFRRNKELFAAFHPTVFFMPSLKEPDFKTTQITQLLKNVSAHLFRFVLITLLLKPHIQKYF